MASSAPRDRSDSTGAPVRRARPAWVGVAVPTEHGGWGLTAEPVLLGLLVEPSAAGAAIGLAALLAFVVRTPVKVVLVDRFRHRWLARTRLAATIAAVELGALAALGLVACGLAGVRWLWPVALAVPLFALELWFDMRSRSRRTVPELAGAVGIAAVAAAVVLAGGGTTALALGAWVLLAGRAVSSIPFVRSQVARLHAGAAPLGGSDLAQVAGVALAAVAVVVHRAYWLGALALVGLVVVQVVGSRREAVPVKVLGVRQTVAGLVVVLAAAIGTWAW
jgi:hypothetical protein